MKCMPIIRMREKLTRISNFTIYLELMIYEEVEEKNEDVYL